MKALGIAFVVLGLRSVAGVLGAAIQVPLSTTPSTVGVVEGEGEDDWEIASKWCFWSDIGVARVLIMPTNSCARSDYALAPSLRGLGFDSAHSSSSRSSRPSTTPPLQTPHLR